MERGSATIIAEEDTHGWVSFICIALCGTYTWIYVLAHYWLHIHSSLPFPSLPFPCLHFACLLACLLDSFGLATVHEIEEVGHRRQRDLADLEGSAADLDTHKDLRQDQHDHGSPSHLLHQHHQLRFLTRLWNKGETGRQAGRQADRQQVARPLVGYDMI